jgi:hypothetical protein
MAENQLRKSPRLSGSGKLVYPCGPEADAMAERADSMPASERRHRTIKEFIEALQAERIPHPLLPALGRGRSDGVILAALPRNHVSSLGDDEPLALSGSEPPTTQITVNDFRNARLCQFASMAKRLEAAASPRQGDSQ